MPVKNFCSFLARARVYIRLCVKSFCKLYICVCDDYILSIIEESAVHATIYIFSYILQYFLSNLYFLIRRKIAINDHIIVLKNPMYSKEVKFSTISKMTPK